MSEQEWPWWWSDEPEPFARQTDSAEPEPFARQDEDEVVERMRLNGIVDPDLER